jgi:predicted Zn-dependent peptidase
MTAVLDNGLQVIAFQHDGQHIVSAELVLDLPLSCEPADSEGIAAIIADTLSEGTSRHPGNSFADTVANLGASMGAAAGQSASQLMLDVPSPNLGQTLGLLAEAVAEPTLADADISRAKTLRLAEIEQETADPSTRAHLAFREACVRAEYRFSRPGAGRAETVTRITPAQAREFHHCRYQAKGATLILAGDFAADPLQAAEAAFGSWGNTAEQPAAHQHPTGNPGPAAVLINHLGAVQAEVRLGTFSIDRGDPAFPALQLACRAMGGAFLSRLNKVLREEKGYSYGVNLAINPLRHGGLLALRGSFRTEVAVDALDQARDLLDIGKRPFSAAELTDAVTHAWGSFPLAVSTADRLAGYAASLVNAGLDLGYPQRFLADLRSVTPEAATATLAEQLPGDQLILVVVGDAEALADPLRAAGWEISVVS